MLRRRRVEHTAQPARSDWADAIPPFWILLFPVFVALGTGMIGIKRSSIPDPAGRMGFVADERSIAVLSFRNPDEQPDDLAQGIRQDIITHLSQLEDLVVSTHSWYKAPYVDRSIGAQLGVRYLLAGITTPR